MRLSFNSSAKVLKDKILVNDFYAKALNFFLIPQINPLPRSEFNVLFVSYINVFTMFVFKAWQAKTVIHKINITQLIAQFICKIQASLLLKNNFIFVNCEPSLLSEVTASSIPKTCTIFNLLLFSNIAKQPCSSTRNNGAQHLFTDSWTSVKHKKSISILHHKLH